MTREYDIERGTNTGLELEKLDEKHVLLVNALQAIADALPCDVERDRFGRPQSPYGDSTALVALAQHYSVGASYDCAEQAARVARSVLAKVKE
jgi:hypothetical protein